MFSVFWKKYLIDLKVKDQKRLFEIFEVAFQQIFVLLEVQNVSISKEQIMLLYNLYKLIRLITKQYVVDIKIYIRIIYQNEIDI